MQAQGIDDRLAGHIGGQLIPHAALPKHAAQLLQPMRHRPHASHGLKPRPQVGSQGTSVLTGGADVAPAAQPGLPQFGLCPLELSGIESGQGLDPSQHLVARCAGRAGTQERHQAGGGASG